MYKYTYYTEFTEELTNYIMNITCPKCSGFMINSMMSPTNKNCIYAIKSLYEDGCVYVAPRPFIDDDTLQIIDLLKCQQCGHDIQSLVEN